MAQKKSLQRSVEQHALAALLGVMTTATAGPVLAQQVVHNNKPQVATAQNLKKVFQGEVAATDVQLPWDVPAGHVVQLRISGGNVHVDLRDAQGRHVRRLGENGRGVQTVIWPIQGAAQEQVWVTPVDSTAPARYQIEVLKIWVTEALQPLKADDTPMGPQLFALQQQLQSAGDTAAALQYFWQQVQQQGTPLVEPWKDGKVLVTFLWRDRGNTNVRLFGSPSGDHNPLQKLANSDVWWTSVVMDPRARLSYGFAPDVPQLPQAQAAQQRRMILATLQRDPLNPNTFPTHLRKGVDDVFQGRSVMTLPQAAVQPWVAERAHVRQGTLTRHVVHSQVLGNDRDVWTYVPAGVTPATQQGLLVLFDAHAFVHDVPTPRILDNLIADGLIPPMAAVIVGNASPEARGQELPPNLKFAQFMAEELMPWVKQQGLSQLARKTVVAGSSYGGLVSSYLGLTHPELFGNVLSMSGSYWWAPEGEPSGWMQRAWKALPNPAPHVRFYIDAGALETGRGGRAGILESSRELGDILRARGLSVTQREFVSGHDYVQWQGSLGCGLVALLAPERGAHSAAYQASCQGAQLLPAR